MGEEELHCSEFGAGLHHQVRIVSDWPLSVGCLVYIDVKPAAGRRATSDFSCGLIDKQTEGPLEMRVDC